MTTPKTRLPSCGALISPRALPLGLLRRLSAGRDPVFARIPALRLVRSMLLSLALTQDEKQRILDHLPTLSQWQIEALMKVFADERRKFRQWAPTEFPAIAALQAQAIQTALDLVQANAPVTPPLLEAWTRRMLRHGTRRGLSQWLGTLDDNWWAGQRHARELYRRITPAWPAPLQPLAGTEAGTGAGSSQFMPWPRPRR